jgi:SNF2 family DNA or RNA helicase
MAELSPERAEKLAALKAQLEAEEQDAKRAEAAAHFRTSDLPLVIYPALRTEPMSHQVRAMNFSATLYRQGEPGVALLMEQGTGKSLVAIGLATAMAKKGAVRWALIVCPNSLKGTWAARDGEIAKHSALRADVTVLRGPKAERLRDFKRALAKARRGPFQWIVVNIDHFSSNTYRKRGGIWAPTESFQKLLDMMRPAGKDGLLILDESSKAKNPESIRTVALHQLAPLMAWRMILTGTPVTRGPLDVWAQFEVLKKGALGVFSYLGFERRYGVQKFVKRGTRTVVETVAYRHLEELEERVARLSFRVLAKDCLDLPEVVRRIVPVELSREQDVAQRELRTEMMALLESGALVDGRNILTRFLRMAQIMGGSVGVVDEDGQPTGEQHVFDPNPKLDAVAEYLDLAFEHPEGKAVVFAQFRAEIAALEALAKKRGWGPVVFHGDVPEEKRDAGRQRFQEDPAARVFIAQYQTGSYGLNLTAANHLLFFGLTFDLELFSQARKRVHRKGQERTVNEVILQATTTTGGRTMDHMILAALDEKQDFADLVTGDHRSLLEDLASL